MSIVKKLDATYILVINVSEDLKISVGDQLGEVFFKQGDYIYVGSASGCLVTRLQRHLRKEKNIFWHIDYLLDNQKSKILQIWTNDTKKECQTAELFLNDSTAEIVKKGFGSSDCKCFTHLFFVQDKKNKERILKEIGFSIFYSFQNLYF